MYIKIKYVNCIITIYPLLTFSKHYSINTLIAFTILNNNNNLKTHTLTRRRTLHHLIFIVTENLYLDDTYFESSKYCSFNSHLLNIHVMFTFV